MKKEKLLIFSARKGLVADQLNERASYFSLEIKSN
jgi:hypothetical protein